MASAVEFLLQSQNADGGWGYRVGKMSYVEPTAAVLVALRSRGGTSEMRARDFLLSLQHSDGGWGIGAIDQESGWMTAWAVRALIGLADSRDAVERGVNWLTATAGFGIDDAATRAHIRSLFQMDMAIRGWPWQPGDASWVYPTALAMLALLAAGRRNDARVQEGVLYLYDRALPSGGWNIGNPRMFDKYIPATTQDTAVALLALHVAGEPPDKPHIMQAIRFLCGAIAQAKTPAELAWGIHALQDWNMDVGDALARLNALQSADGSWQGNLFTTAIAIQSNV